ncbi:MAG TPA: energy-coupling factor transporter transmembrane component T [Anaerolineales bacterium]|nr:energy-coupling factor transporter transmembrane component T [Anaerolineales bacterium]HLO34407.1 energy-coupling factor transporter transmembrane component T [Anaerolineales bacterium]
MNTFSMYVARESGLHKLHPLTKGSLTLLLLVAGLTLPGNWTGYFLVLFVILPLAYWGQIFSNFIKVVLGISLPFVLSVVIIQSLFWGKGTPLFEFWVIAPKQEGALFALISVGRIILVMSDFILFAMSTRPDTLMISLKQVGVPSSLAYIIVTTLQIIPRFQSKALTILDAQRSRGLETEGNLFVRARALIPIVLPLVLGSLVDVEERAIAIEARGFNSSKKETSLIEIPDTNTQIILRRAFVILMILSIVARIAWQLLN